MYRDGVIHNVEFSEISLRARLLDTDLATPTHLVNL